MSERHVDGPEPSAEATGGALCGGTGSDAGRTPGGAVQVPGSGAGQAPDGPVPTPSGGAVSGNAQVQDVAAQATGGGAAQTPGGAVRASGGGTGSGSAQVGVGAAQATGGGAAQPPGGAAEAPDGGADHAPGGAAQAPGGGADHAPGGAPHAPGGSTDSGTAQPTGPTSMPSSPAQRGSRTDGAVQAAPGSGSRTGGAVQAAPGSGGRTGGAVQAAPGSGSRTGGAVQAAPGSDRRTAAPLRTGTGGALDAADAPAARPGRTRARAWAELLRLPALFTVPGDALAGAAATGARPGARTLLAIGSSLCLYEAGMALNDWADRAEDARDRPHRPLPSGRVRPAAALTAACALTGAGLALAARAGRPALAVAAPLAATVWSYDLALKHTPAGPAAMAAARGLDLLLGAAATSGRTRAALPSAALLGSHTLAVTTVSRREAQGGSSAGPLAALATSALLTGLLTRRPAPAESRQASALRTALGAAYAATVARPYLHAALNPSPPLTQRAVGGGIRATIPLQAALSARSGARVTALAVAALAPVGRACARKVSIT